jgi:probable rRNA maturation factor
VSSPASRLTLDVRGVRVAPSVRRTLVRRLLRAMAAAGVRGAELSLSLTDDAELRRLNRDYAGEDHATDVLSFSQREGRGLRSGPLGDVIISVPTARRQARAGGHALFDELLHLAVHGLVHLLGYDHASPDEERIMFGYEARLRAAAARPGLVVRVRAPSRVVSARRPRRA